MIGDDMFFPFGLINAGLPRPPDRSPREGNSHVLTGLDLPVLRRHRRLGVPSLVTANTVFVSGRRARERFQAGRAALSQLARWFLVAVAGLRGYAWRFSPGR